MNYLFEPVLQPIFLSPEVHDSLAEMCERLPNSQQLWVMPDAVTKANGVPNGIALIAPAEQTLLLPSVLRDPGCGFLLFKINKQADLADDWHQQAGQCLHAFINGDYREEMSLTVTEKRWLADFFKRADFSEEELQWLYDDLFSVTNTIEIRKPLNEIAADFIGFIHSGTFAFPKILALRFVYRIAEYADTHQLFTLDDIDQGIYGVPLQSELGQEYASWLQLANDFAAFNRKLVFSRIKRLLEIKFEITLTQINDRCHAGALVLSRNNSIEYSVTRGVQHIHTSSTSDYAERLCLIAGQRESIAALVLVIGNHDQLLLPHGVTEFINPDINYQQLLEIENIDQYVSAQNAYYDTTPQFEQCIPYTACLLKSLQFFERKNQVQRVALLAPLINVHSPWLRNLN